MPRPCFGVPVRPLCLALSGFALGLPALSQTAPDAGSLLRQNQRPEPPRPETVKPIADAQKPAATADDAGASVAVRAFVLEGNETIESAALQARLQAWLGQQASLRVLREAAASVCAAYAEAGWLAHCDLPPQDISEGRIRIRILEARYSGLKIEGEPKRFKAERVAAMVGQAVQPGEKLPIAKLERMLLLVSALPGIHAAGALSAGEGMGDTLVTLDLTDTPLLSADLSLDNGGQRSTGSTRASAALRLDSPFGLGDAWSTQVMHTRGNNYLRLGGSLPVGLDGWRVGANASALRYKLVEGEMKDLGARGTASSAGLEASYPLLRSRSRTLQLALGLELRRFDNEANGATTSRYKTRTLNLGLQGYLVGAGGATSGALTLVAGRVNLSGSPAEASDTQGPQTAGRFLRVQYSASRQQGLTPWLNGYASLSGQAASKNLDTSERFYLGGPGGVRAYPGSEGGGSEGQMLNLELRARLPAPLSASAFYDWGRVTTLVSGQPAGPGPNAFSLKGAGVSLAWSGPMGLNLRATLARRIGANPNPSHTGSDQDGTLKRNRLWLQASLPI